MKAALLQAVGTPLQVTKVSLPKFGDNEVLIQNRACGICRTDLHIVDGELIAPQLPIIPGHQIVGEIVETGAAVEKLSPGQRIGVPWLGWTCGHCTFCKADEENLCDNARFTGYHRNGGFAQFSVADARFCFPLDEQLGDIEAAPLLCGGLIGYRAYRMIGNAVHVGFYGFGSAAHILLQVANYQSRKVYAITRPGDIQSQDFARYLGACWAGGSDEQLPELLDAAIIFAPAGELVPIALKAVRKGGKVICAGIHMSDIPSFAYSDLWGERKIQSIANLTRSDGEEFLKVAAEIPIQTEVQSYPLENINEALDDLRNGRINGSGVIIH